MVNVDRRRRGIERAAQDETLRALVRALDEAYKTDEAIAYNVSPETCLDTLLFTIREGVYWFGSSHWSCKPDRRSFGSIRMKMTYTKVITSLFQRSAVQNMAAHRQILWR